jgi:hypothetical protein
MNMKAPLLESLITEARIRGFAVTKVKTSLCEHLTFSAGVASELATADGAGIASLRFMHLDTQTIAAVGYAYKADGSENIFDDQCSDSAAPFVKQARTALGLA